MSCANCEGENFKSGFVEDWDGICPECGKRVKEFSLYEELLRENRIEFENNFFLNNKTLKLNKNTIVYIK